MIVNKAFTIRYFGRV